MNWQNAIKEYQLYLKIERGLSKNTIDSYTKDLEKLCLFLKENNMSISPIAIDANIVKQFIYEVAKKLNPRSQARIISGLRSFFDYLVFEEYRNTNPTDLLETPKIGTKLPDTLSQNEIDELFKSFRTINFRLSFS
ncbi:MAG: integrase/recombinase XerD [Polaribacter sp.]|jgi:integrase/recombinase XerD